MVDMEYVDSSNVEAVGYDEPAMELHVLFKGSPTVYVYQEVPQHVHEEFMMAPSKGKFVHYELKPRFNFYTL